MKFVILALCFVAAMARYDTPTPEIAAAIKASWAGVKNNQVEIFYEIFKAYPDIQEKFPQFAGKKLDDLKGAPEFKQYAETILDFFGTIIDKSESDEFLIAQAKLLAKSHKSRASPLQFENFGKALMVYLKASAKLSADDEKSWESALDHIFHYLKLELTNA